MALGTWAIGIDYDADLLEGAWEQTHGFSDTPVSENRLIGWWQFDESSGSVAQDRSASLRHLSVQLPGTGPWTNGIFNGCIQLDGAGRHLVYANPIAAADFTFSIWARTIDESDLQTIAVAEGPGGQGWRLTTRQDGRVVALFNSSTQTDQAVVSQSEEPYNIKDGGWHHVALTYDSATGNSKLYVDGELEGSAVIQGQIPATYTALRIGHKGSGNWWKGALDEARLYDSALGIANIRLLPETFTDSDQDGATNYDEFRAQSDPRNAASYPPPLTGLALWLDAGQNVTSITSPWVTSWSDRLGRPLVASAASDPARPVLSTNALNQLPAISFQSTSHLLSLTNSSSVLTDNVTVFVVGKHSSTGAQKPFVMASDVWTKGWAIGLIPSGKDGFYAQHYTQNDAVPATALATNTYAVMMGQHDGLNAFYWRNGQELATDGFIGSLTYTPNVPLTIGGCSASTAQRITGQIAEILLYNRAIEPWERQVVEGYLWQKYAVGAPPLAIPPQFSIPTGAYSGSQTVRLTVPSGFIAYYDLGAGWQLYDPQVGIPLGLGRHRVRAMANRPGFAPTGEIAILDVVIDPAVQDIPQDGLEVWLRGDFGIDDGSGKVMDWIDISGKNHAAVQSDSTKRPVIVGAEPLLSNRPALRFEGNDYLTVSDSSQIAANQMTLVVIGRRSSTAAAEQFLYKGTSTAGYGLGKITASTFGAWFNNSANGDATTTIPTGYGYFLGRYDGNSVDYFKDGQWLAGAPYSLAVNGGTTNISIGARGAGLDVLTGEIAEVFIYKKALTPMERKALDAYVHGRYGLGTPPVLEPPVIDVDVTSASIWSVTMTSVPGSQIFFTTNNLPPTETETDRYLAALELPSASALTVRAVTAKPGYAKSPEAVTVLDPIMNGFSKGGLNLWLRSDAGVEKSASGSVHVWRDQSGAAHDADQSHSAFRPAFTPAIAALGNRGALRFNGSNSILRIVDSAELKSSSVTVFAVAGPQAIVANKPIVMTSSLWTAGYGLALLTSGGDGFYAQHYTSYDALAPAGQRLVAGQYAVVAGNYDQLTQKVTYFRDGIERANVTFAGPVTYDTSATTIGGRGGGTEFLNGDLAEILIYNRTLTSLERREVDAYLYAKYGVGAAPRAIAPSVSVQSGMYSSSVDVTLSSEPGMDIYYTLDGSVPAYTGDPLHPIIKKYAGPFRITAPGSYTLRAMAWRPGFADPGEITTTSFIVDPSTSALPREGMQFWVRSDLVKRVIDSSSALTSAVEAWPDLSGNGHVAAQATAVDRPVWNGTDTRFNGKPSLLFDGVNHYFTVPHSTNLQANKMTVVAVARRETSGGSKSIISKGTNTAGYALGNLNGPNFGCYFNHYTNGDASFAEPVNIPSVFIGTYDQNAVSLLINGERKAIAPYDLAVAAGTGPLYLGVKSDLVAANHFSGEMAEIMIYNRALTPHEIKTIQAYCRQRYGLGAIPQAEPPILRVSVPDAYTAEIEIESPPGFVSYWTDQTGAWTPSAADLYQGIIRIPLPSDNSNVKVRAVTVAEGFTQSPEIQATVNRRQGLFSKYGLQLWLRSDAGVEMDPHHPTKVRFWRDQGALRTQAGQSYGDDAPTLMSNSAPNQLPAMSFDGTSDLLTVPLDAALQSQDVTMFVVGKTASLTAYKPFVQTADIWTKGYGMGILASGKDGFYAQHYTTYDASATDAVAANTYATFMGSYDGQTVHYFRNFVAKASVAFPGPITYNPVPCTIGGGAAFFQGEIAEIMIYDRVLASWERKEVEAYYHGKYSVGAAPRADAPVFNVLNNAKYGGSQEVTITASPGMTVHYTLDGSEPTVSSPVYEDPLWISAPGNHTIKAMAAKEGFASVGIVSTVLFEIESGASGVSSDGLVLWLRADEGVGTDASSFVNSWEDGSGLGNRATGTSTYRPLLVPNALNGKPVVRFDTTNDLLSVADHPSLRPEHVTVVAVGSHGGTYAFARFLTKSNFGMTAGYGLAKVATNSIAFWNVNYSDPGNRALQTILPNVHRMLWGCHTGQNLEFRLDGVISSVAHTAPLSHRTEALEIGNRLGGDIAEVLLYDRVLTEFERAELEDYLARKYAVAFGERLVGEWLFNEGTGSSAIDSSPNQRHAAPSGGAENARVDGFEGRGAVSFDGVDDRWVATGVPVLGGSRTVSAWARAGTSAWASSAPMAHRASAFTLETVGGTSEVRFSVSVAGTLVSASANLAQPPENLTPMSIQDWHHYAGTYDQPTRTLRLYVDGVKFAEVIVPGAGIEDAGSGDFLIGSNGTAHFQGELDDVRLYRRALVRDQVFKETQADSDGDGLSDAWEYLHLGTLSYGRNDDPDEDGLTLAEEFQLGGNPGEIFISSISGNGQFAAPSAFLPEPLATFVIGGTGLPAWPANVAFTVVSGSAQLAPSAGGTLSNSLVAVTNSSGLAAAYVRLGSASAATSVIKASAGRDTVYFEVGSTGLIPTPSLSPASGSFATAQWITLTSLPSAQIHFTLDGSEPTSRSPFVLSGGTVAVQTSCQLKAKAFSQGYSSETSAGQYQITGAIAACGDATFWLAPQGVVYAWGSTTEGLLGDGVLASVRASPAVVRSLDRVTAISAGTHHILALRQDGEVWAWGLNDQGLLGDGSLTHQPSPVRVQGLSGITAIAAGAKHSLALSQSGAVYSWGFDHRGQLGNGSGVVRPAPVAVPSLGLVKRIAAGHDHSIAVNEAGDVYVWGANDLGQLGDGSTQDRSQPHLLASVENLVALSAKSHTVAIDDQQRLWTWGANGSGQIGDGTTVARTTPYQIASVSAPLACAAGSSHTLVVTQGGAIWAWGANSHGQLGTGTLTPSSSPASAFTLAGGISLAAGGNHSLALQATGAITIWGGNLAAQSGDGTRAAFLDSDGDSLPDSWELQHFGNLSQQAAGQFDGDGIPNGQDANPTDPGVGSINIHITTPPDGSTIPAP